MKRLIVTCAGIIIALASITAPLALSRAIDPGRQDDVIAATTVAKVTVTPVQRTCAAFTAWERHETRANLDALVVDSFHVAPKYLGADVGQLYADVEGGGTGSKYVTDDKQYVYEDCNDDSGL